MQQIIPHIYTIEGLRMGRVYVIQGQHGLSLIDTSLPNSLPKIEFELRGLGYQLTDIKRILITHAHYDHIGSLRALQQASGALVLAPAGEAVVIRGAQPLTLSPAMPSYMANNFKRSSQVEVAEVHHELHEGDVLDEVLPNLQVISVAGHSPDQLAFWWPEKRLLFCGDTVMNLAGLRLPIAWFTVDMPQAKRSINKIALMNVDILCPGHGPAILSGADKQIDALSLRFPA